MHGHDLRGHRHPLHPRVHGGRAKRDRVSRGHVVGGSVSQLQGSPSR